MNSLSGKAITTWNDSISETQGKLSRFSRDENGATAVEYALIVGLITVMIFGAVQLLGGSVSDQISKAKCAVQGQDYPCT